MEFVDLDGNYGGYDVEPVAEVPNDFFCMICLKIMRDPVQFLCGHGMCNGCFTSLLKNSLDYVECPQCRRRISRIETVPAHMIKRVILALKVKCNNEQCSWIGELGDFEKHKLSCKYEVIPCTNDTCEELFERHQLKEHLNNCTQKSNKMIQNVLKKLEEQQKEIDVLRNTVRCQQDEINALKLQRTTNNSDSTAIPQTTVERLGALERLNPISGGYIWLVPDLCTAFNNGVMNLSSEEFLTCLHGYICRLMLTQDVAGRLNIRFMVLRRGIGNQRHFNYTVSLTACAYREVIDGSFNSRTFKDGKGDVLWYRDLVNFIPNSKYQRIKEHGYLKLVCNFSVMESKVI